MWAVWLGASVLLRKEPPLAADVLAGEASFVRDCVGVLDGLAPHRWPKEGFARACASLEIEPECSAGLPPLWRKLESGLEPLPGFCAACFSHYARLRTELLARRQAQQAAKHEVERAVAHPTVHGLASALEHAQSVGLSDWRVRQAEQKLGETTGAKAAVTAALTGRALAPLATAVKRADACGLTEPPLPEARRTLPALQHAYDSLAKALAGRAVRPLRLAVSQAEQVELADPLVASAREALKPLAAAELLLQQALFSRAVPVLLDLEKASERCRGLRLASPLLPYAEPTLAQLRRVGRRNAEEAARREEATSANWTLARRGEEREQAQLVLEQAWQDLAAVGRGDDGFRTTAQLNAVQAEERARHAASRAEEATRAAETAQQRAHAALLAAEKETLAQKLQLLDLRLGWAEPALAAAVEAGARNANQSQALGLAVAARAQAAADAASLVVAASLASAEVLGTRDQLVALELGEPLEARPELERQLAQAQREAEAAEAAVAGATAQRQELLRALEAQQQRLDQAQQEAQAEAAAHSACVAAGEDCGGAAQALAEAQQREQAALAGRQQADQGLAHAEGLQAVRQGEAEQAALRKGRCEALVVARAERDAARQRAEQQAEAAADAEADAVEEQNRAEASLAAASEELELADARQPGLEKQIEVWTGIVEELHAMRAALA